MLLTKPLDGFGYRHKRFGNKSAWKYLCVPYKKCRVGQGVKTPPFHGGITGSNPVRGTKYSSRLRGFLIYVGYKKIPPENQRDKYFNIT